jgi:hypothetical protein
MVSLYIALLMCFSCLEAIDACFSDFMNSGIPLDLRFERMNTNTRHYTRPKFAYPGLFASEISATYFTDYRYWFRSLNHLPASGYIKLLDKGKAKQFLMFHMVIN